MPRNLNDLWHIALRMRRELRDLAVGLYDPERGAKLFSSYTDAETHAVSLRVESAVTIQPYLRVIFNLLPGQSKNDELILHVVADAPPGQDLYEYQRRHLLRMITFAMEDPEIHEAIPLWGVSLGEGPDLPGSVMEAND